MCDLRNTPPEKDQRTKRPTWLTVFSLLPDSRESVPMFKPRHNQVNPEGAMSTDEAPVAQPVRVIVVANEKGGSGKSTVAVHVAIALMKRGRRVATIDLDTRQRTFTHYIENRKTWAARIGRSLEIPEHLRLDETDDGTAARGLADIVDRLSQTCD